MSYTPDEVRLLEEEHLQFIQTEISEEIDLYDTKGEYSHTEIRNNSINL